MQPTDYIWMDGKLVPWEQATVHVLAHALHYGTSVFEGVRAYNTKHGPAVLALHDHTRRLFHSAKMMRMEIPYTQDEINLAILETLRANNLKSAYIRPLVFRGMNKLGVDGRGCPVQVAIATIEWGRYLGEEAIELCRRDRPRRAWVRQRGKRRKSLPHLRWRGLHSANQQLDFDGYHPQDSHATAGRPRHPSERTSHFA